MFFSNSTRVKYFISVNILLGILLASNSQNSIGLEHVVKAVGMKWKPEILVVQPGDSVKFINMMGHDTQSMTELTPPGYIGWKSQMGDEGFTVKFEKKGVYFHKCNPHVNAGMFGAILVTTELSLDEFDRLSTKSKELGIGGPAVRKIFKRVAAKTKRTLAAIN